MKFIVKAEIKHNSSNKWKNKEQEGNVSKMILNDKV